MISEVSKSYNEDDISRIEEMIKTLNDEAVKCSDVITAIQIELEQLSSTTNIDKDSVSIVPFAKKVRDLNKNISIQYGSSENLFTMDYHGMGTRSWSSLLIFKSFIKQNKNFAEKEKTPSFIIVALEEPEAHLYPNAQKQLYSQISDISGQVIVSTHSPYIAASANLSEIRGIYKKENIIKSGLFNLEKLNGEEIRKIKQKVINTRGEIFFAKALIFFEGETEEQALPIMAEKFFERPAYELGINFISVGGAGQYFPFIYFAEVLNIPWYIFSDGESSPVKDMTKAIQKLKGNNSIKIEDEANIFVIEKGEDFEKYIIGLDYLDDIKKHLKEIELPNCHNDKHKQAKEKEIDTYTAESILKMAKEYKTKWGPIFGDAILNSENDIPPLLKKLFEKIKEKG